MENKYNVIHILFHTIEPYVCYTDGLNLFKIIEIYIACKIKIGVKKVCFVNMSNVICKHACKIQATTFQINKQFSLGLKFYI